MKYRSFPAYIGIQQAVTSNNRGFIEFDLGGSLRSYNDSQATLFGHYWTNYEQAVTEVRNVPPFCAHTTI
jgi:hypothetical protein